MTAKIVADAIRRDLSSTRTAAQIRALVPGQWATDADVPPYLYMSLRELLLGPSASPNDLANIIVDQYGTGASPEDAGIHILTLPFESVVKDDSMQSNLPGAEVAILKILTQIGESLSSTQVNLAEQADLRIRMLIDFNCRKVRRHNGEPTVKPGLDNNADSSVLLKSPTIAIWLGFIDNESAIAKASLYRIQYHRVIV